MDEKNVLSSCTTSLEWQKKQVRLEASHIGFYQNGGCNTKFLETVLSLKISPGVSGMTLKQNGKAFSCITSLEKGLSSQYHETVSGKKEGGAN
ncbi:hypothetical protein TNCV_4143071 [Trichonephila clavipes]|nr:hypothetical protein TNCV_4143071 [Trichonephila clavipes]